MVLCWSLCARSIASCYSYRCLPSPCTILLRDSAGLARMCPNSIAILIAPCLCVRRRSCSPLPQLQFTSRRSQAGASSRRTGGYTIGMQLLEPRTAMEALGSRAHEPWIDLSCLLLLLLTGGGRQRAAQAAGGLLLHCGAACASSASWWRWEKRWKECGRP